MFVQLTGMAMRHAPRVLALIAGALYLWLFLRIQWRIGDEGSIVYGAVRVAEGALPSRDFFEVMGPGTFYWLALWFKAFGTSWLTSRLAVLTTALVSGSAIYYATTRQYRGRWAYLPAAMYTLITVPFWPGANHHLDANMWALLAFALSVSTPQPSRRALALSGIVSGLCSTIMPQKGVLVLAGLCGARLIDGARTREWKRVRAEVCWQVMPFLAVGTTVVIFYWLQGALSDLVYTNVIWPATNYRSVNAIPYAYGLREFVFEHIASISAVVLPSPLVTVATAVAMFPLAVISVLPLVASALVLSTAVQVTWKGATTRPTIPLIYWSSGFALFASELHRQDLIHLTWGSPILLICVLAWLASVRGWLAIAARRTLVFSIILLAAALAVAGSVPSLAIQTRSGEIHRFERDEALEFLHQNVAPGEPVFVYPYYPMYYFLANVRNPTRYSVLMYRYNTADEFDEVIRDLEAGQVRYVLWDTVVAGSNLTQWFPGYQDPSLGEQRLERYLEDRYNVIGVRNQFRVLERK
jgi:hypothetical protein